ncbi:hypothetical protein CDAR_572701 [Caerostris darwini]|uniref:Uncharacterized protein n=1 Tax=Caerostris darwini TaxID=1538125 RepID=A0AAV4VT01_9ARAC|nr:hypothetical protein CDAR_572701 [Caerostris darwini]
MTTSNLVELYCMRDSELQVDYTLASGSYTAGLVDMRTLNEYILSCSRNPADFSSRGYLIKSSIDSMSGGTAMGVEDRARMASEEPESC